MSQCSNENFSFFNRKPQARSHFAVAKSGRCWWMQVRFAGDSPLEGEMDSNHRSLSRASRFILRKVNCAGIDGAAKKLGGVPMVRIHLPPAGSQVRTRPHGFGNLPPASHASAPPIAELARHPAQRGRECQA